MTSNDLVQKLSRALVPLLAAPLLVVGCAPEEGPPSDAAASVTPDDDAGSDAGPSDDDGGGATDPGDDDAGLPDDERDAGSGPSDGGAPAEDAGPVDAGHPPADAAMPDDDAGGPAPDAGADAGSDAGSDAGGDAGGGPIDAGPVDGGSDAGPPTWDAGTPVRHSCLEHLLAGELGDGVYPIDPAGSGATVGVWCDMTTDDGGWTLVGATRGGTLNDQRADYYDDLARDRPTAAHLGIWDGLRALIDGNSDVRFTCRVDASAEDDGYDVDLSFYDVGWYREITTGSDADACFEEDNGAGYTGPWARRNNLTGEHKGTDDDYDHGYQGFPPHFEGEDSCGDEGDFAVDFDDRGMDSVPFDGTDWGEDDHGRKCGSVSPAVGSWFVWVRE